MPTDNSPIQVAHTARIAVYDDLLSAPRIIDIAPMPIAEFIEQIASNTYEAASRAGGSIPYTVIREVSENFIHAQFKEPTVSVLDGGNTIRFADQGPGISNKESAQEPGFTSATGEMKQYIRGVGSGLPIVKEYLKFSNGHLLIEDNIREGTVITVTIDHNEGKEPVVYRETASNTKTADGLVLAPRELDVLALAASEGAVGPTELKNMLDISVSTGYRILKKLKDEGYCLQRTDRKYSLTEKGQSAIDEEK